MSALPTWWPGKKVDVVWPQRREALTISIFVEHGNARPANLSGE